MSLSFKEAPPRVRPGATALPNRRTQRAPPQPPVSHPQAAALAMKNQCNTLRQIPAVSGGRQKDSSRELANAGNSKKPRQMDKRGQMVVPARAAQGLEVSWREIELCPVRLKSKKPRLGPIAIGMQVEREGGGAAARFWCHSEKIVSDKDSFK